MKSKAQASHVRVSRVGLALSVIILLRADFIISCHHPV